jgi:hypothetical protein
VRSVIDQDSGSYNGGYLIDCTAYDGTAPHCDNAGSYWCDRNSTCYNVARQTNCTASSWSASFCDTSCVSGYTYCDGSLTDGDGCEVQSGVTNCPAGNNNNQNSACACVCDTGYLDCDASGNGTGNGCEVQNGGSCSVGSLTGTYSGCTCVVTKSYFQTGTFTEYQTNSTQNMLWFKDYYANAILFNATNYNNQSFTINTSGCIKYMDNTTQCTASTGSGGGLIASTPQLYNDSTKIYLNESYVNITWVTRILHAADNSSLWVSKLNTTDQRFNDTLAFLGNDTLKFNITGGNITGNVNMTKKNITDVSNLYVNVTRYPSGSCQYDNGTAILFRSPCDI